jgi:hypothetical protein
VFECSASAVMSAELSASDYKWGHLFLLCYEHRVTGSDLNLYMIKNIILMRKLTLCIEHSLLLFYEGFLLMHRYYIEMIQ